MVRDSGRFNTQNMSAKEQLVFISVEEWKIQNL